MSFADSTVIGVNAVGTGSQCIAIAGGDGSVFCGEAQSICIGNAIAQEDSKSQNVVIGQAPFVLGAPNCVAIGPGAGVYYSQGSVAIGQSAAAGATGFSYCCAIGRNTDAAGNASVCIGQTCGCGSAAVGSIAMGSTTQCNSDHSVIIGPFCNGYTGSSNQVAIGNGCGCTGSGAVGIGYQCNANGMGAYALGYQAVNNTAHSVVLGDSSGVNVRPMNNQLCDLGMQGPTGPTFKTCWLKFGPAVTCLYNQYSSITVNNTAVETSITSGSNAVGTLVLNAAQSLGTQIYFRVFYNLSVATGHLNFNFRVNGSDILASANAGATGYGSLTGQFVITSASNLVGYVVNSINGVAAAVTQSTSISYTAANSNTWDITALWSAANSGNTLSVDQVTMEVAYAQ